MTAAELHERKTAVPSEMTTVQWDRVKLEVRERSFFMAAVSQAEILQIYQAETGRYIKGEQSEAETRRALREKLAAAGYLPRPGEEGGIKDLTTTRRMDVVLRTNLSMAQNKAAYDKQILAIKVFPARRMVRLTPKRVPRNWPARWAAYEGQPGVNAGEMAALLTSPVWVALNRFGAPYAPYDFGSGMGDEAIRIDEARQMGLLPAKASAPEPAPRSFNETLSATPKVTTPALRNRLAKDLTGLAEWQGDTLIYTDPNGTRPVLPAALAATIATPNTANIPLLQAEALRTWSASGPGPMTRGSDALYHFRRLVHRVLPLTENEPLTLTRRYASVEAMKPALSQLSVGFPWTPKAAPFPFTAFQRETPDAPPEEGRGLRLTLRVISHQHAKDLTPAVETLADHDAHGHHVLFERGRSFRVVSVSTEADGVTVTLTEEAAP